MNTVTLTGRLTTDPDITTFERDNQTTTVAKFDLACDRAGRDGTDFIPVTVFDTQADAIAEHIHKGHLVAITGRLHHTKWTTDDGQNRQALEVIARQVDFLARPNN